MFEENDEIGQKATLFWRRHKLGELVDEDEFVKGAILFKDLRGAREFEFQHASDDPKKHAKAKFTLREKFYAELTTRQNMSLRWYARSVNYVAAEHEGDSLANKMIFSVGDAIMDSIWGRLNEAEDKSLWDHVKSFSSAQWQIFATCCLAAMTQYVPCYALGEIEELTQTGVGTSRQ